MILGRGTLPRGGEADAIAAGAADPSASVAVSVVLDSRTELIPYVMFCSRRSAGMSASGIMGAKSYRYMPVDSFRKP